MAQAAQKPKSEFKIRPVRLDEAQMLEELITRSVMRLQAGEYTENQRKGALGTVFGVDRQLIHDGTYYVVEAGRQIVGCGGWSKRKTLFGSDNLPGKNDAELDPRHDAARIRAFFVDPDWSRQGIGSLILRTCEGAAIAAGFNKFELAATLTGVPLYSAYGFAAEERAEVPLPNGDTMQIVRMTKAV